MSIAFFTETDKKKNNNNINNNNNKNFNENKSCFAAKRSETAKKTRYIAFVHKCWAVSL